MVIGSFVSCKSFSKMKLKTILKKNIKEKKRKMVDQEYNLIFYIAQASSCIV